MNTVYAPDADALINLYQHYPSLLSVVRKKTRTGSLVLVGGIFRELLRGSDKLRRVVAEWQKKWNIVFEVNSDAETRRLVTEIERRFGERIVVGKKSYPGLWKSAAGRRAAESQIIATAKTKGLTVVSNDRAVSMVCMLLGVPCISWQEFARRLGVIDQLQFTGMQGSYPA